MNATPIFITVATVTILSAGAAGAIALTGEQPDPSRMAVAARLAQIAFVDAAALAALLASAS